MDFSSLNVGIHLKDKKNVTTGLHILTKELIITNPDLNLTMHHKVRSNCHKLLTKVLSSKSDNLGECL